MAANLKELQEKSKQRHGSLLLPKIKKTRQAEVKFKEKPDKWLDKDLFKACMFAKAAIDNGKSEGLANYIAGQYYGYLPQLL